MVSMILLSCVHAVIACVPLVAALWGMVAVACYYEWRRYLWIVRGARLAPWAWQWLVIEPGRAEYVQSMYCQEIVIRRYCR